LIGGPGKDTLDAVDSFGADDLRGGPGFDVCRVEAEDSATGCEDERLIA
jgi:hypothetical protein